MKRLLVLLSVILVSGLHLAQGQELFSPVPGSPLRQAILDDLRAAEPTATTQKEKKQKIVFEKVQLRVSGVWAWVSAEPRTADNKWRSEPLTGLMHHSSGHWKVVEYVSDKVASAGNPQAAFTAWRDELLKKNPDCPPAVVPLK